MCFSNTDLNLNNRIGLVGRIGCDPLGKRELDPPSSNEVIKKHSLSERSKGVKFTMKNKKRSWYGNQRDIDNFFVEGSEELLSLRNPRSEICFCGDKHFEGVSKSDKYVDNVGKYLPQFTSEGKRTAKVLKSGETFSAIRNIIDRIRG